MVKLNFENFNDVIRAYWKYFRKSCWSLIDAEFSPLFTRANCALILLIVAEKSNFKMFNDVIITLFLFNILKLLSSYYFVHLSYFPTSTSVLNGFVSHIWGQLCQWRSSASKSGGGPQTFFKKKWKAKKKKPGLQRSGVKAQRVLRIGGGGS